MRTLSSPRGRHLRLAGLALLAATFFVAASVVDAPENAFAQSPEATTLLTSGDSLVQHIEQISARVINGQRVYQLTLKPGISQDTAILLADYVAEDGDPGSLTVIGDGFSVERSTIRPGSVPLPPPPPRARRGGSGN